MNKIIPSTLLLTLLAHSGLTLAQIDLPQMGDSSGSIISPHEEKKLGEAFMRELRRSVSLIDDPESVEYIQALGYKIAAQAQYPGEFTFFIVDEPSINAFAAPGGYIGIHSGLILETQNESELASVVAHETAHVTQRHLPRAFEQASKMNVPSAAAMIAAIILAQSNPNAAQAAIATSIAGAQQSMINFTRENEKEADNIGMQYLVNADFDPKGMPAFFGRLQKATRYYNNKLPEYLSTHPITTSRIAESESRALQLPPIKDKSLESFYPLLQAKLRVNVDRSGGEESLKYYETKLQQNKTPDYEAVYRYGRALALLKLRRPLQAKQESEWLNNHDSEHTAYINLAAQIDLAQNDYPTATTRLENALKIYPRHYPLTMLLVEAQLNSGKADEARRLLLDQIYYRTPSPALYQLLAKASDLAGYKAQSFEAMAEYHYQQGAITTAISQIDSALALTGKEDFHAISRLEAKKKQLTEEFKLKAREN